MELANLHREFNLIADHYGLKFDTEPLCAAGRLKDLLSEAYIAGKRQLRKELSQSALSAVTKSQEVTEDYGIMPEIPKMDALRAAWWYWEQIDDQYHAEYVPEEDLLLLAHLIEAQRKQAVEEALEVDNA